MQRLAYFLSLAFLALSAMAQVRESTTVEVIQVPVYVTAHGAAVTDLTRDNFRLFVNGKPQAIDYFDVIDFAGLPADEARDPRQRRLYLFVFDLTFSSANSLHRAQKAAERIIESGAQTDTFGIATLRSTGGVDVVVPFSHDRLALVRAVRNLRPSRMADPLRLALTSSEREGIAGGTTLIGGAGLDGIEENALGEFELQIAREAIANAVGDLADLAVRLAPLEGIKHIVLLSAGFDASLIHGVSASRDASAIGTRSTRAANLNFSPLVLGAIRRMNETFSRSSVFLDAIDIAGLRPMQRVSDNEALYTLTRDTGGEVVDHRNDLAGAMQYLTNLQRVAYVLSFNAPHTERENNKIAVKLVNVPASAHASYRTSYSTVTDPPDSGDPLRLADIVMNDIPQTGATTKVTVDPAPGKATVNVEIAGGELAAQANGMTLQGEALIYIFSGPGAVGFDRKGITIEPRAMTSLATSSVRLGHTFDLPPGHYTAKVLVRIGVYGSLGFARTDFTVPAQ